MQYKGRKVNPYPLGYIIVVLIIVLFAIASTPGCSTHKKLEDKSFKDICISICRA